MIPISLADYYKLHAPIYDATRWSFLFGRNQIYNFFPELAPGSKLLDIGCGTGKITSLLYSAYPNSSITAIDSSQDMLAQAKRKNLHKVRWLHGNYSSVSFQSDTFDLIIASYSLTMVEHLDETLAAIKQHLKANGTLLVVDFDQTHKEWFSNWMAKNHVHFEHRLFERLAQEFKVQEKKTHLAFFGLYNYSTIKACLNK